MRKRVAEAMPLPEKGRNDDFVDEAEDAVEEDAENGALRNFLFTAQLP